MQSDLRSALVYMCRRVLHPLVRMLVRFGVSAGELKSIVDSVYAQAGSEYLRSQGERVSYSRLAVITGINRSVLPTILATPSDQFRPRSRTQLHRAARVLTGWHEDAAFQTRTGEPAAIPVHGRRHSFRQLAHRYSGGVYYQTLLSELVRVGAVKEIGGDRVRALRRSLSSGGADAESVYEAGEAAGDLMATLEHNLTSRATEQLPVRSLALEVDARSLPLFRAQLGKRADAMLEVVEAFLEEHRLEQRTGATDADAQKLTLGATVFAVRRDVAQPQSSLPGPARSNATTSPRRGALRPRRQRVTRGS
jgi:hypothetical protein